MLIVYLILITLVIWLVLRFFSKSHKTDSKDERSFVSSREVDLKSREFTLGDLCPHCGLIIMMPTDLEPICMGCSKDINDE